MKLARLFFSDIARSQSGHCTCRIYTTPRIPKYPLFKQQRWASDQAETFDLASNQPASTSSSSPPPANARSGERPKNAKAKARPQSTQNRVLPRPRTSAPVLQEALAYTSAESYDLAALQRRLKLLGLLSTGSSTDAVNLMGEAIYLPKWPVYGFGEAFIFDNGSYVTWGTTEDQAETLLKDVIRGGDEQVEKHPYKEPQMESLDFVVSPDADKSGLRSGTIVIAAKTRNFRPDASIYFDEPIITQLDSPSPSQVPVVLHQGHNQSRVDVPFSSDDLLVRLSFSAGLIRSTKLGYYEDYLEAHLSGVAHVPGTLKQGSERELNRNKVIRMFGDLLDVRQQLNLTEANLLDPPEVFWESNDPSLEVYYDQVCDALDFERRLQVVNTKLDYASTLQSTLLELTSIKTSHRLEWIIIILIAAEIALVIMREGLPFWPSEARQARNEASTVRAE